MTVSRPTAAFGSVVLALLIACSACGSSSSSSSLSTLRGQFQAIVTSTDQQLTKDRSPKHPDLTNAQYSLTFRRAASQIRALKFPASMQHDANALVTALDGLSSDAAKVAEAAAKPQTVEKNVLAMAKLNLTLMEAEKSEQAASNALRHDLGLPPATTTTTTAPSTLKPAPSTLTPAPSTLTPAPSTVPSTTAAR